MNDIQKIAATLQLAADDIVDGGLIDATSVRALLLVAASKVRAIETCHLIAHKQPEGRFVALYDDGSGANMFQYKEGGLFDADGNDCCPAVLDDYLYWLPIPDNYKFWGEDE